MLRWWWCLLFIATRGARGQDDLATMLACTDASRRVVAAALQHDPWKAQKLARSVAAMELQVLNSETPYGPLLQRLQLQSTTPGQTITVEYIHPSALIWHCAVQSSAFLNFLMGHMPDGQGGICWYADDVRPGNQLHPQRARLFYCVYFCIIELPHFFRTSSCGWMDAMCIPVSEAASIRGGLAALTAAIFLALSFPLVIDIPYTLAGVARTFHLELSFKCFCADEKALKEQLATCGASGYRVCSVCSNIYGRIGEDVGLQGNHRHYTCHPAENVEYTEASHKAVCDLVQTARENMSEPDARQIEMAFGLHYNEGRSPCFAAGLHRIMQIPTCVYYDAQRCLYASGGAREKPNKQASGPSLDAALCKTHKQTNKSTSTQQTRASKTHQRI